MEGIAFFVERVEVDKEGIEKEIGETCFFLSNRSSKTSPGMTQTESRCRAEQDVADYRFCDICCARCLQEWAARLVAKIEAGDVLVRHSSIKCVS